MPLGSILGKKSDEERIEAIIVDSFPSNQDSDIERAQRKIVKWAEQKPLETVTVLLNHYHDDDERVRRPVRQTLNELSKDTICMEAIMTNMVHPSRTVRKAVQSFLGESVGAHAVTYASIYEQTMLLVAMAKRKDVPVEDIVSLADLTKMTFLDGETMRAIRDIGLCLDTIKHRYRSSEQLKDYLAELLKMAPDLSRMGIYGGSIEEPLRKAMKASRERTYDDTSTIIEERNKEFQLRGDLLTLANEVKDRVKDRPKVTSSDLYAEDRVEMARLYDLIDRVKALVLDNERTEAKVLLQEHVDDFLQRYKGPLETRVHDQDRAATFVLYAQSLAFVKLASYLIPTTAEDIYQKCFRQLEDSPSIHVVLWPETVIERSVIDVRQSSDNA
jgi:histone H3/H4